METKKSAAYRGTPSAWSEQMELAAAAADAVTSTPAGVVVPFSPSPAPVDEKDSTLLSAFRRFVEASEGHGVRSSEYKELFLRLLVVVVKCSLNYGSVIFMAVVAIAVASLVFHHYGSSVVEMFRPLLCTLGWCRDLGGGL